MGVKSNLAKIAPKNIVDKAVHKGEYKGDDWMTVSTVIQTMCEIKTRPNGQMIFFYKGKNIGWAKPDGTSWIDDRVYESIKKNFEVLKTMELRFKFNGDNYVVTGDMPGIPGFNADPDSYDVKKNGKDCEDFGEAWNGHRFSKYDVAMASFAAYMNLDESIRFITVSNEVERYRAAHQSFSYEVNGHLIPNRYYDATSEIWCDLWMITQDKENPDNVSKYYSTTKDCVTIITRLDGSLVTNMENFFVSGMCQDAEDAKIIFINDEMKGCLKEYDIDIEKLDIAKERYPLVH